MVQFYFKLIKIITIIGIINQSLMIVNGQYPGYRFSPMAFSPYHPARINHETLPISQAEFAQLVAESMATSNGPHHHHPPNTDQNYEGPEHWANESPKGMPLSGAESVNDERNLHHHHHHHHYHHNQPNSNHESYQANEPSGTIQSSALAPLMHGPQSQYQPDERGTSDAMGSDSHIDEYSHRPPVFETDYHPDPESSKSLLRESEMYEAEPPSHIYGGRPNAETFQAPHQRNHHHHHHNHPREHDEYSPANGETDERARPVYGPNDPPSLAYHQDFARQPNRVRHPHPNPHQHHHSSHHHHRPSFHYPGSLHALNSNPRMMMMAGRHQLLNRPRYPMPPQIDHYMAADSSTNNAIAIVSPASIASEAASSTTTTTTTTTAKTI